MRVDEEKQALRKVADTRRTRAAEAAPDAALQLSAMFPAALASPSVVAGYVRFRSEMDPAPLLQRFSAGGAKIAMPCVGDGPLTFRAWGAGDALVRSRLGVREPAGDAPPLVPDLVLVPLLAFDRRGARLGYGQGHYDRTLAALRGAGSVVAVGLAYAAQEISAVPTDSHDQLLDWIVTEREAIKTSR